MEKQMKNLPFFGEGMTLEALGENQWSLQATEPQARLHFGPSRAAGLALEGESLYTLCLTQKTRTIACNGNLWLLPEQDLGLQAVCLAGDGLKTASALEGGVQVCLEAGVYTLYTHTARPACDLMGRKLSLDFEGGGQLEITYVHFYWDSLVPMVLEQTDAKAYPLHEGYVVSTLGSTYSGTYPDVDHEFQCKGRLALHGEAEMTVVRRMMNLQFQLMREDPIGLWRNPCAVQPNGDREYHVRRNSLDNKENAEMFLVTGNVEILETAWLYYAATKDTSWLQKHIEVLEGAASLLEHLTDANGILWSDVFYEDQVIKDGAECMSAAMAAHGLSLLAQLERLLGREPRAAHFDQLSARIAEAMVRPLPEGFWDEEHQRFVDWIDRSGRVHDHIHLLGNCLPVAFGYASAKQAEAIEALMRTHFAEFQRFPTFLSPVIQDYTDSEIGDGGPYDLCAAGRYWCWDATYWSLLGRGDILGQQLRQVAVQAETDGYRMGERYDMNHVYYLDDKNWHGAAYYYEYPCVFLWVLAHEYLGLRAALDADVEIAPALDVFGSVRAEAWGIAYTCKEDSFAVENISGHPLTVRLELERLYRGKTLWMEGALLKPAETVVLQPAEVVTVMVQECRK